MLTDRYSSTFSTISSVALEVSELWSLFCGKAPHLHYLVHFFEVSSYKKSSKLPIQWCVVLDCPIIGSSSMNLLSTMVCRLVSLEHMFLTTSALFSTVCVALIPNRIYQSSWASQLIHLTFYESAPLLSVVVMCSQRDSLCHVGIDEARVLLLRWMKVRSAICSLKIHPHLRSGNGLSKFLGEKRLRCVLLRLIVMVKIPLHLQNLFKQSELTLWPVSDTSWEM